MPDSHPRPASFGEFAEPAAPPETRECRAVAHARSMPTYCKCEATDDRVCWMIKHGESRDGVNRRCSCPCHTCSVCNGTGFITIAPPTTPRTTAAPPETRAQGEHLYSPYISRAEALERAQKIVDEEPIDIGHARALGYIEQWVRLLEPRPPARSTDAQPEAAAHSTRIGPPDSCGEYLDPTHTRNYSVCTRVKDHDGEHRCNIGDVDDRRWRRGEYAPSSPPRTTDAQGFAIAEQARAIATERDALRAEVANLREIANSALNRANELRAALLSIRAQIDCRRFGTNVAVLGLLEAIVHTVDDTLETQNATRAEAGDRARREGK